MRRRSCNEHGPAINATAGKKVNSRTRRVGYEEIGTIAAKVTTGSTGTWASHQQSRLFKRPSATESGVTQVAPTMPLTSSFTHFRGYPSRGKLNGTVLQKPSWRTHRRGASATKSRRRLAYSELPVFQTRKSMTNIGRPKNFQQTSSQPATSRMFLTPSHIPYKKAAQTRGCDREHL